MTKQVWIGGLSGGVLVFVWSVVAWILLPLNASVLGVLPAEDEVVSVLRRSGTPAGLYAIPGYPPARGSEAERAAAEREWEEKTRRGPLGFLVYQPEGVAPNRMFRPLVRGLGLCLAAGVFAAWALSRAGIRGHLGRVLFVVGLGLFGWILGPGMQWFWFHYPSDYILATLADSLVGWALAGVVQAGIVRS